MDTFLDGVILRLKKTAIFGKVGFKAMLAWHYMVLFSPLLISGSSDQSFISVFSSRQPVLYLVLSVTFIGVSLVSRLPKSRMNGASLLTVLVLTGIIGFGSSLAAVFLQDTLFFVCTVFIGVSQALLMTLWIRYHHFVKNPHLFRTFAIDMVFGAFIAFIVSAMEQPFSYIIMALLPLVACATLAVCMKTVPILEKTTIAQEDSRAILSKQERIKKFMLIALPMTVFALVFGFIQGTYVAKGVVLLVATNVLILLGIVLCGFILLAIPHREGDNSHIDVTHRLAVLFLVVGIVALPFLSREASILSEVAIMIGFNLFDFGALAMMTVLAKGLRIRELSFIVAGRSCTYLGLLAGFYIGHIVAQQVQDPQYATFILGGLSVVFVVSTVLTPFANSFNSASEVNNYSEHFRGEESHTSETALHAFKAGSEDIETSLSASEAARYSDSENNGMRVTTMSKERTLRDTPFRRICQEIAAHYCLSPREREVLFLIAKGRNAEYVQKKLVISTHTAKTHIANIYQKLGVHSSQEILDLLDEFKERGCVEEITTVAK